MMMENLRALAARPPPQCPVPAIKKNKVTGNDGQQAVHQDHNSLHTFRPLLKVITLSVFITQIHSSGMHLRQPNICFNQI